MQFLALIFALTVVHGVSSACDPPTSASCTTSLLQCCGLQLKADLGLANCYGILAYEPECHRQEIENMYINGTGGLLFVCDAFNKYYGCLGQARRDCTSIGFHVKAGLRLSDAINAVSMYHQFGFACGAGFEGFSNNDACMAEIFSSKQNDISRCRAAFAKDIAGDYKDRCLYFEQYTGCFNKVFDHSLCNAESSWWGCEYARQSGKLFRYQFKDTSGPTPTDIPPAVLPSSTKHSEPADEMNFVLLMIALYLLFTLTVAFPFLMISIFIAIFIYYNYVTPEIHQDVMNFVEKSCEAVRKTCAPAQDDTMTRSGIDRARRQYMDHCNGMNRTSSEEEKEAKLLLTYQVPILTRYYESIIQFFKR